MLRRNCKIERTGGHTNEASVDHMYADSMGLYSDLDLSHVGGLCPIFEFEFDLANQLTSWFELSNQSNQEGQEKSIWISTYMISVRLMMHLSTRMKSETWCIKF